MGRDGGLTNVDGEQRFGYLNLEGRWPLFETQHLERTADGSLRLARVPRLIETFGAPPAPPSATPATPGSPVAPAPPVPTAAGIAVLGDGDCSVFASDPADNRVWRIDGCSGEPSLVAALVGQVVTPRGLATGRGPTGWRLYVADTGHNRVLMVDPSGEHVLAAWSGGAIGTPVDLAAASDASGAVYLVDGAGQTVQRVRAHGSVDASFWSTLSARPDAPTAPTRVALGNGHLYILDVPALTTTAPEDARTGVADSAGAAVGLGARIVVADSAGAAVGPGAWPVSGARPLALAVSSDTLYLGYADGSLGRFSLDGAPLATLTLGEPVAALATGCKTDLLAGSGGLPLLRLQQDGAFLQAGTLRGGPFVTRARPYEWQRLRVDAGPLDSASHLQIFTYTSSTADPPPEPSADGVFDLNVWQASPVDETDVLILGPSVRQVLTEGPPADPTADQDPGPLAELFVWVGGVLHSDGTHSPALRQMRLDFAPPAYLDYLPAVYREGARRPLLLGLVLSLLGSELDRFDSVLSGLSQLFDPAAAPPEWLAWLAGWLDFQPSSRWSTTELRSRLAQAMDLYAWRGTAEGLRRYLDVFAGVQARIDEPATSVGLFRLDDVVSLGVTTQLAPEHEQGAVLDSTATFGQSSLLDPADIGAPLFTDVVHRFSVQVYASDVSGPATLDTISRIVDREKPAHTVSHVCVIGPTMRVGAQARIGIDSIVGGLSAAMRLGNGGLGVDSILANREEGS
jgi:phage tail-like protein